MAAIRRKKPVTDDTLIDLSQAKVGAEQFWEKNQKYIFGILGGLVLIVGGYAFYRYVIIEPRQKEAVEQLFQAQFQFERDSFNLALNNPGGGYSGFLDIINQYGGTPAANSAQYYAGISYLNIGNYEEAIRHLNKFKPKDPITTAMKFGALGDAHSELNDFDKALGFYRKAADAADNDLTAPYFLLKVGQLSEHQGKYADARKAYEQIRREFPLSEEGQDMDKYLARLNHLENKGG